MKWSRDPSVGEWLRDRLDDPWRGTMHDLVPRQYDAYVRVFHPAEVTEIPGERMPDPEHYLEFDARAQEALLQRMVHSPTTWAATAAAFGTVFHAGAQWNALVHTARDAEWQQTVAPDGRQFDPPMEGDLPPDVVARLAGILAAHTTMPQDGYVALWEGDGALLGHVGDSPSRAFFQVGDPASGTLARHNAMLGASFHDRFNAVFRPRSWQEGILSREISEAPRLQLPGRGYVVFRGDIGELAAPDWVLHVPWRDLPAEAHGFEPGAHAPSLAWPGDRAWVWVTEVDWDSTIIGGSADLVAAVCADPTLEALPIPADTRLSDDSDEVNR